MSKEPSMVDSLVISAMWDEFRASPDYANAVQWCNPVPSDGLFTAFRSGVYFGLNRASDAQREPLAFSPYDPDDDLK